MLDLVTLLRGRQFCEHGPPTCGSTVVSTGCPFESGTQGSEAGYRPQRPPHPARSPRKGTAMRRLPRILTTLAAAAALSAVAGHARAGGAGRPHRRQLPREVAQHPARPGRRRLEDVQPRVRLVRRLTISRRGASANNYGDAEYWDDNARKHGYRVDSTPPRAPSPRPTRAATATSPSSTPSTAPPRPSRTTTGRATATTSSTTSPPATSATSTSPAESPGRTAPTRRPAGSTSDPPVGVRMSQPCRVGR